MKSIRINKACRLNPHVPLNQHFTWRDIERKMRQRRRIRRNHHRFWLPNTPEGNTRRVMQERAGRL